MATITAEAVRELRERTGAGMMDCKRALEEANGDVEKAVTLDPSNPDAHYIYGMTLVATDAAKAKAEEAKIAAARADNCTRAKAQMTTLDSGIRLARANAKGEREFLDDKQRADETKRVRDIVAADCK